MTSEWQPPKDFRSRPVAVLGAGVLGRRIAACWLAGGWNVHIRDPSEAQRIQAQDYVKENIGSYTVLTQHDAGSLSVFEDLPSTVKDAWLVIEAVPEKLAIKINTFADLEKYAPADCILASNSSSYKSSEMITEVSDGTKKRILNTHYTMPPDALIVELMTDGHTSQEIFPFLIDRHKEAGLHPIVALKESTGFVFNRVWAAIKREVLMILNEGVSTPDAVDGVFREMYGAKQGPCRMMDNVGLDTVSLIEQHYVNERSYLPHEHLEWLNSNFVNAGKLGKKTPTQGGLYDLPKPGETTDLIFLNLGTAEPLNDKLSMEDVQHQGSILRFNPDEGGRGAMELVVDQYMPDGIDIAGDRMFWTDMGNPRVNDGQVLSAKLDGSDVRVVVPSGQVHTPKQLICDQEGGKLYFCDREGYRVFRVNFDGSDLEVLVQTGDFKTESKDETYWCVGVAISKKFDKLFWTQKGPSKGSKGRILQASLDSPQDPSSRPDIEVVMDHLPEPIDLEFDDEAGVIYWTDRGELPLGHTLNKKTLVGEQPAAEKKLGRQILAQGLAEAIGMKLDKMKDCIWVSDLGGHIWKCNPHRPAFKEKAFESETKAITGLTLIRT